MQNNKLEINSVEPIDSMEIGQNIYTTFNYQNQSNTLQIQLRNTNSWGLFFGWNNQFIANVLEPILPIHSNLKRVFETQIQSLIDHKYTEDKMSIPSWRYVIYGINLDDPNPDLPWHLKFNRNNKDFDIIINSTNLTNWSFSIKSATITINRTIKTPDSNLRDVFSDILFEIIYIIDMEMSSD